MTRTHRSLTDEDIGKHVVNADGEDVGVVSNVDDGVGYVDPEPGLGDRIRSRLGWGHTDQDDYPLKRSQIAEITDEEVRLRRD